MPYGSRTAKRSASIRKTRGSAKHTAKQTAKHSTKPQNARIRQGSAKWNAKHTAKPSAKPQNGESARNPPRIRQANRKTQRQTAKRANPPRIRKAHRKALPVSACHHTHHGWTDPMPASPKLPTPAQDTIFTQSHTPHTARYANARRQRRVTVGRAHGRRAKQGGPCACEGAYGLTGKTAPRSRTPSVSCKRGVCPVTTAAQEFKSKAFEARCSTRTCVALSMRAMQSSGSSQ